MTRMTRLHAHDQISIRFSAYQVITCCFWSLHGMLKSPGAYAPCAACELDFTDMDSASSCFGGHLRSLDTPNDFRGDLRDLHARSLTADPCRTFPAKVMPAKSFYMTEVACLMSCNNQNAHWLQVATDPMPDGSNCFAAQGHADMEVNSNQQLYCRLASQHSSTPVNSWRPGPGSGNCQTLPMTAQAEPHGQRISAGPCSPFQALSQCQYVADRSCSLPESGAQHMSQTPLPDLCDGLEDVSGLTEPIASSLSCSTPNPYAAMSSSSIDRYPSAPLSPTQSLLAAFASAASADPLPSPSLSPPDISPSRPAAPTEAEHGGSMAALPHMEVAMSLTVAPAAFSHPIRVNKAFSPAFQVCLAFLSALAGCHCMHKQCCSTSRMLFCDYQYAQCLLVLLHCK